MEPENPSRRLFKCKFSLQQAARETPAAVKAEQAAALVAIERADEAKHALDRHEMATVESWDEKPPGGGDKEAEKGTRGIKLQRPRAIRPQVVD